MNSPFFDRLHQIDIIPVLEIDSALHARPLAESLFVGGLPIAEITWRTDAALESIRVSAPDVPDVIVGAGTVINREQAQAAREAGAQFLVSPGMVEEVVIRAQENQIPILAGAATPTEMMRGINLRLDILKFFPTETIGGVKAIKAISEPFPQLSFIPTGGIRLENLKEYLQYQKIRAVDGSGMAKRQMVADSNFEEISHIEKQARDMVKEVRSIRS